MPAEQKTGVIKSFYDSDSGTIQENGGPVRDFFQPGARVEFQINETVTYLLVTLPNGNPPIVTQIKKPS